MKFRSRIAGLVAGAVFLVAGAASALAQSVPGLMFPPYNGNGQQFCYVARPVQGDANHLCGNLNAVLPQIANTLRINGQTVQFYAIFVREPDQGIPQVQGTPPAGVIANAIADTYKTRGVNATPVPFPANSFVMLVMTQRADGTWLMAERWGNAVTPYFDFPTMKNILDGNVATLRGGDPRGYVEAVARATIANIGTRVNAQAQPTRPTQPPVTQPTQPRPPVVTQPSHTDSGSGSGGTILIVLLVLGVAGAGIWWFVSSNNKKAAAKSAYESKTADTKAITDNLNTQVDTLVNAYGGMAMGGKEYTAGSKSDKAYKAACLTSATFFAHAEAVKAHKTKIDAAIAAGDYDKASALYTETLQITGEELAPALRTATSGKFKVETARYCDLVAQLGAEFDAANKVFGELDTAVTRTTNNKKAIETDLAAVNAAKTAVAGAGISFEPFQTEFDEITAGVKAFVGTVFGAPLDAFDESEALKARVTALKTALDTVMELKKNEIKVSKPVADAHAKVDGTRGTKVEWKFATGKADATYELIASGTNPNDELAKADAALAAFTAAIAAGKPADAEKAKAEALEHAANVGKIVDGALAAKKTVDDEASGLKAAFGEEPGFAFIGNAYARQDFVAAATAVATFKAISALRHTRTEVQSSLTQAAHYVTGKTDGLFATAAAAVENVVAQTRQPNANWPAIAAAAAEAGKGFENVTKALAADREALDGAKSEVAELRKEYDAAVQLTKDERVVQGPEGPGGQLHPVGTTLTKLEGFVHGTVKQDWASVKSQAHAARGTVGTVSKAAQAQIDEIVRYEAQMDELEQRYGKIASTEYSVRMPRQRGYAGATYRGTASPTDAPAYSAYNAHREAAEAYLRARRFADYERELAAARAQTDMINTFMWWSLFNSMTHSSDPWAQRYAYDQGFRDGQSYDAYHEHVRSSGNYSSDSGWTPTPVSSWTPSSPVASCGSAGSSGSSCGSNSGSSQSSCGSSSSSSSSSCSSSSSSSCSSSSSSSSSSCSSSSSSSCSSSSSSSCSSSSSSCGSSS